MLDTARLFAAGALAAAIAFGAAEAASPKVEPATVEAIPGSDLRKLVLQARAVERLGIETAAIKMETVGRKRTVAAEVFVPDGAAAADGIWLKVLPLWDAADISRELPASVFPASSRDSFAAQTAAPAIPPKPEAGALYFLIKGGAVALQPKHRVLAEVSYTPARRTPVPSSATFYDAKGATWVYEMVAPMTYVRHAVRIAYVEGETAYLDQAPADNARIVTVGAPMLQGVEFKVGH